MSFVLEPAISCVNSIGHSLSSSVENLLLANHIVASGLVAIISFVFNHIRQAILTLLTVIQILLEDLSVFLAETLETLINFVETIFSIVDSVGFGCHRFVIGCKEIVTLAFTSIGASINQVYLSFFVFLDKFGDFFSLLGSSVVLLINLVPRTVYLGTKVISNSVISTYEISIAALTKFTESFRQAPGEQILGLLAGVALTCASVRLTRTLARTFHITPTVVLQSLLKVVLFLYLNFVRGILAVLWIVLKCITTVLTHINVARFHQAGDSDVEDDGDGADETHADLVDSSDNEENERMASKRRNYEILLKRREQKLKNRLNQPSGSDENVEDMLFEQFEREREDKLCVICQDKEKCIMILPCRHLCLCQDCQGPLKVHGNNVCPICRRNVRQMIKAYL